MKYKREKKFPEHIKHVLDFFLKNDAGTIIERTRSDEQFKSDVLAFFNNF
ncbi:MAG: hypothetical protein Q6373_025535 [Candidatus Sigynarchaeota archaeon]